MPDPASPARLALADGAIFTGEAFGATTTATAEVVFNTSLTGYQEILTDPSYCGQFVVMTAPHIGNVGVNEEDMESARVWAAGLIVREVSPLASNYRATETLPAYLAAQGIPGISELATRALVRHIRRQGAMMAALSGDPALGDADLVALARNAPGMDGRDLVREVTCAEPYHWREGIAPAWQGPQPPGQGAGPGREKHVVAYDFGIKRNILRHLVQGGCRVTVVPATTPAAEALTLQPDGVFLSNGPGDPAAVTYAIEAVRELLAGDVPLFGICLGHQILALALGGRTHKMKFGHRGGNQPVEEIGGAATERNVAITSHNHGFAVTPGSLPAEVAVTHVNLNDHCIEGLRHASKPAFSVQYHPEAAPGPHDAHPLFARFLALMGD